MEIGLIKKVNIDDEMQQAYLDYAMSVIVSRALPDARDGLKPVHRRILYAMYDMGLRPDSPHKKSARIVGEVLGKYHPHGDMAVYDAMARMAQDFSMRYMLVEGQGNFGSIDGDSPAAMRYTEARLRDISIEMLQDIEKDTIDFEENFDGTLEEPSVLPSAIPNLIVNGATGIAVGMATSIPPHNLAEVIDALLYMLSSWNKLEKISTEDLMQFIKGPDFPTGGLIIQDKSKNNLISAYSTGRGRISIQARAHLEEMARGKTGIIITEIPYMTNKSSLIERIANLAREEKIEGISDLRDESDRQGMRIVIELTKNSDPEKVLNLLNSHTSLRTTFSIIMLALINGKPRLLNLKQALRVFLEHRMEIVRRKSEFDLNRARKRAHILEGLLIALSNLDEIIELIKRSSDANTAKTRLIKKFKLSDIQAQAILDMQLRRLAALEQRKISQEYRQIKKSIKELEALLKSPLKIRRLISEDLKTIKEKYADRRRTHIVQVKEGDKKSITLSTLELTPEKTTWVSISKDGKISRTINEKMPRLSGKEAAQWLIKTNTRNTLYLVNKEGLAAAIPVHAVPESASVADGVQFSKISPLPNDIDLGAVFSLPQKRTIGKNKEKMGFIITMTSQGMIKKSSIDELPSASANTFTLVRVNDQDQLINIIYTNGENDLLLITKQGMAIRFTESSVRSMGLVAAGVMAIKLKNGDEVTGVSKLSDKDHVFIVASNGYAKRVNSKQFPKQGRHGQGVVVWKLPQNVSIVGFATGQDTTRIAIHFKKMATKAIRFDTVPLHGRTAKGKKIQQLKSSDKLISITTPIQWTKFLPKILK